jgi:hypothetical protein
VVCSAGAGADVTTQQDMLAAGGWTPIPLQSFTASPLFLDHRRLPGIPCGQHVIPGPEHLGSLEIAIDLKPNLPTKMMRPQLADGGEWLLPAGLGDVKQIAEVRGVPVPVFALQGGRHVVWIEVYWRVAHFVRVGQRKS